MSEVGAIALAFLSFVAGAITVALILSMHYSNERYDECEACKEYLASLREQPESEGDH